MRDILSKMDGICSYVGNWWGDEYISILQRTKILVVEGSMRSFVTQKYLEGAACGAMLLGDVPSNSGGVFVDGVSMVGSGIIDLEGKIRRYLLEADERVRISDEGRRRVIDKFNIRDTISEFVEVFR
jgi:spore maturation protein CgeB